MAYQSEFRVWKFQEKRRCRWCRRPTIIRTTDEAKRFAFEPGAPVIRVDEHPVTLVKFDVIDAAHLHSRKCPKRNERAAENRKKKRGASRFPAQGRLL